MSKLDRLELSVPLTAIAVDHSDEAQFLFSFSCDRCGKEWASQPVPFKSGGFSAVAHEEARAMIWAQEHRAAFEEANLEAHFHFNCCPRCGRWVCDECFEAEGSGGGSACRDCAHNQHSC